MWSSWSKNTPMVVSPHENLCILVHTRLSLWLSACVSALSCPEFYKKSYEVMDCQWVSTEPFELLDDQSLNTSNLSTEHFVLQLNPIQNNVISLPGSG